ncbi:MAG: hypothetical protein HYV94_04200 [Candidatus Rokubacteria bacterium]|nr:hypothetical protein [Candidatus Rokubacteria bacterium]
MLGLALILLVQASLDCGDPAGARQLLGRAQAFEINHLEDAYGAALLDALARCPAPDRAACERARREEFRRTVARSRAEIEAKYRRLLEDFQARCRAPLT